MLYRIALKLNLKDGTRITVYSCARVVSSGWQGGVKMGEAEAVYYDVFGSLATEVLDRMEGKILVDVEGGNLVISVNAQEAK